MSARRKMPPPLSDAEEARIQAGIAKDPDNPEITEAEFAKMRPASEVLPPALYAALTRPRGRPKAAVAKQEVKLRLDPEIVTTFKQTGAGWQTRMNDALAKAAKSLRKRESPPYGEAPAASSGKAAATPAKKTRGG